MRVKSCLQVGFWERNSVLRLSDEKDDFWLAVSVRKCCIWGIVALFFLGHMVWAYVWAMIFVRGRGNKVFVPAVLVLAVVPDVDLLLGGFGVYHHTFTHSLFFWLVLFMPFFMVFRLKVTPYFVAVAQHFVFGDLLVGEVMVFWPFNPSFIGFQLNMPSLLDVALETGGLVLAATIAYFSGDLKRLLKVDARNSLMIFPFLALTTSMLFFAVDWPIIPLVAYVGSSSLLTTLVLAHLILAFFIAASTLQGLKKILGKYTT